MMAFTQLIYMFSAILIFQATSVNSEIHELLDEEVTDTDRIKRESTSHVQHSRSSNLADIASEINDIINIILPGQNVSKEFESALRNIDSNSKNASANTLCLASIFGNSEIVNRFLSIDASGGNVDCTDKWTPLHFAVALKNSEVVTALLSTHHTNVNASAYGNISPLHLAVVTQQKNIVADLIKRGASIDQQTESGFRPIHLAVLQKQFDIINYLIIRGANLEVLSSNGVELKLLNFAATANRTDTIDLLVAKGVNINGKNISTGVTSLHTAVLAGDFVAVKVLVQIGADVNVKDKQGQTPLHYAAASTQSRLDILRFLIKNGADSEMTDNLRRSALHLAVRAGRLNHVESLLATPVKVNAQDYQLMTPLHIASGEGSLGIVNYLILNGADVNAIDKYGQAPLHHAIRNNHFAIVHHLIENDSSVNVADVNSLTPLHLAVIRNDLSSFLFLRKSGADIFSMSNQNVGATYKSPLHLAVALNHINIMKSMVKEIPRKDVISLKNTAAAAGSLEVVEYLEDILSAADTSLDSCICSAAKFGHLDVVEYMMENGRVSFKGPFSPLCCVNDDLEVTELFLSEGADANVKCYDGDSPVMRAMRNGHVQVVKRLVGSGAEVNCSSSSSHDNPLLIAALQGNRDLANYLVSIGCEANIIIGDERLPLLSFLIRNKGNVDGVKILVDNGAAVNDNITNMGSALHWAAIEDDEDIMKYLIIKEADINARNGNGSTALFLAARNGNIRSVRCLVENGANIETTNFSGATPLHVAAEKDHHDVVEYLVNEKADINAEDRLGNSPLSIASLNGNMNSLKKLIDKRASISHKANDGSTPLHLAAGAGMVGIVEYLISIGADENDVDFEGLTPLHRAAKIPKDELSYATAKTLVEHGAHVNAKCVDGKTPLHLAARTGNLNTINYLLSKGADINVKDSKGDTPLFDAVLSGSLQVVKNLVEKGAIVKSLNMYKESPMHYATRVNSYCKTWCSAGSQAPQFHEDLLSMVNFFKKKGL